MIRRADDRFRSTHDGVETWHSFSAGAHYDPDNVAHGMLVGVDEHVVAPGAGFDWHGHRGVAIVSWVVSGRLRHEDDAGRVRRVGPGEVLVQRTGTGIRHCEVNASAREPLRMVQMTLVDGDDATERHDRVGSVRPRRGALRRVAFGRHARRDPLARARH